MERINEKLSIFFFLIATGFSFFAFYEPELFVSGKRFIVPFLCVVMFFVGLTLTLSDFKKIFDKKGAILLGVLIQFAIMPLSAFLISKLFNAPPELLLGMVLVGSSAGGTASNLICYLAGGDLALSVTMTSLSTVLAVYFMPLLIDVYTFALVDVPVESLLLSMVKIVLIPVVFGMVLRTFFEKPIARAEQCIPFMIIVFITYIIAVIIALNKEWILVTGFEIYIMVALHNLAGLLFGYWVPRLLKYDRITSRTIAIEVGMQNSWLSVALAIKHFSAFAALPGAIFSIWHNVTGSLLAAAWTNGDKK